MAGLDSTITDALLDQVDELDSSSFTDQAAADEAAVKQITLRREGLQKFFLSLGFSVVVAQDTVSNTSVIVASLQTPPHIPETFLPGKRAFGERGLRYFKVGSGDVAGDFSDAVTLSSEIGEKLAGVSQA